MSQLIVSLIVPALAIALNPVPIIAVPASPQTKYSQRNTGPAKWPMCRP